MIVLGIESSCDETAAAVVRDDRTILSNVVLSQLDEHRPYGGVVPEIAARSHLDYMDSITDQAMKEAGIGYEDLDAVAVTGGPGLIGGVMVGVMTAKAISLARQLPFVAVNHLEGHALTARLNGDVEFPYLLLLVSGGHCQLLAVEGVGKYTLYGRTVDDAVGEAFDKSAKMMGLPYPGGPNLEKMAAKGDASKYDLPRPMKGRPGCDFSFSGLKTAVRQQIQKLPEEGLTDPVVADLCASFQKAVGDVLEDRVGRAIAQFKQDYGDGHALVVGGGVAANTHIRGVLTGLCAREGMQFAAPPIHLCTDNAAMIAWAGLEHFRLGHQDSLEFAPRPRWPLDQ
ncbi:tRNA (adenosine(37)-N6)-threonylcarbamoyltransferase complex transferase subunit TsaD [Aestuariispira insulae]|uniref:tRNA N6-adenosine threonylcarbamoyltransferase n=1 Tax=Aestuariispira insulae TaxID=1461337 RepID=A0A3D9HF43_9PROT|nr:tRNA (adenosine(37)-N6)-threonylcarbamoyltransferase complex transferase subunit TsaD [Aestuariispira insulae]RED48107.1 O-sialoglycoprotein endopeptidase [Aestuariispira insulae]